MNDTATTANNVAKYFPTIIGQEKAKNRLAFELDNHIKTKCPVSHLLFLGGKGDGKTNLVRNFAKNLPDQTDPTKRHKRFVGLTGGQIKSLTSLFEDLFAKHSPTGDEQVTYFFDECHELPMPIQTALLTILEPNKNNFTTYTWKDIPYHFDFRNITFIFATTEENKVFHALRDRLTDIQLCPYTTEELARIVELTLEDKVVFDDETLFEVAKHVRINARKAVEMANNIAKIGVEFFQMHNWTNFKSQIGALPFGLNDSEVDILQALNDRGESRLGALAAAVKRPAKSVQLSLEPYLVSLGLMEIDGMRRLTGKGLEVLKQIRG